MISEDDAMRQAITAAAAVANTLPNPRVGCVLLTSAGEEIATGVHRGAGTPHAEIDALNQAGDRARGATAVVTLEPCHHTGRTGPCDQALIDAGVARVVYAQADPNPVAQGGAQHLKAAGVEVKALGQASMLAMTATGLNPEWTFALRNARPYVTWKFAATLDGRSAAPDRTSQWITGPDARADVHERRAECDAIMVGIGTVLADNPRLTVRDADDQPLARQPLRVVMGHAAIPPTANVLDDTAETMVVETDDPAEALTLLAVRQVRHVWLEGGPSLAGSFLEAGLIDRVIAYIAPAILGAGKSAIETNAGSITDLRALEVDDVSLIGDDLRIIGRPAPTHAHSHDHDHGEH